ncbi:MAG: YdcH family protein [Casimicrobium sp.]
MLYVHSFRTMNVSRYPVRLNYGEHCSMQSDLLPHALHREFPNLADAINRLKHSDTHFAHLLEQHDAIDNEITKSETGVAPINDLSLETLKRQRLQLKDQLYRMAVQG